MHQTIYSQCCLSEGSFLIDLWHIPIAAQSKPSYWIQSHMIRAVHDLVQPYTRTSIPDRSSTLGNKITQLSLITVVKLICKDRGPCGSGNRATQMLLQAVSILLLVFNVPLFLHMLQNRNEQLVIVSKFISSFYFKISQCFQSSQQTEKQNKKPYLQYTFLLCFCTQRSECRLLDSLSPTLFPSVLAFLLDAFRNHPTGPLTDGLL